RIKRLDYGMARRAGAPSLTETGMVVGTPAYMAPEQARGDRAIDARADVYGLGAVLFRCVAGQPPFEGGTPYEVLGAVLHRQAPRLSELVAVSPALDQLVAQMLDKDPERRPTDGQTAWAALVLVASPAAMTATATVRSATTPAHAESARPRQLSSVAVLPFLDMSAGRDQAYLCEGVA